MLMVEHFRATMLRLIRTPAYSVITVFLPAVIFLFVGSTNAETPTRANLVLASFCIFATLGVAFFQFGVGLAQSRDTPWERFVHVLPVGPLTRFATTVLSALVFAGLAVGILIAVAVTITDAALPAYAWLRMLAAVLVGAIPMALFGVAIGYWTPPTAALPVANILYLVLAFGGGLLIPPRGMPDFLNDVSSVMPTRHIAELAWASVFDRPWPAASWAWLAAYTVVFAAIAVIGYRRDEGSRYS